MATSHTAVGIKSLFPDTSSTQVKSHQKSFSHCGSCHAIVLWGSTRLYRRNNIPVKRHRVNGLKFDLKRRSQRHNPYWFLKVRSHRPSQLASLASSRAADVGCHRPPRGVMMSRAFSSAAMAQTLVILLDRMSSTMLRRLVARRWCALRRENK